MTSNAATCLSDIDKVRRVAAGHDAAYVARSRLSRLLLRTTNLARSLAVESPSDIGGRQQHATGWGGADQILEACTRLDACQRSATHASEPLDDRWRMMWDEIESHLNTLEDLLRRRLQRQPAERT